MIKSMTLTIIAILLSLGLATVPRMLHKKFENGHIDREEGKALVARFDGEFPERYFLDVMNHIGMDPEYFRHELTNRFRSHTSG